MSRETLTIAYDGLALRDGAMDVRDLAPALLGLGQLMDAANVSLNGNAAQIQLQVRATEPGSFQISFELIQNWRQTLQFFATPEASGATNLLTLVLGVPTVGTGLVWLTKKLKGRQPDKAEKLAKNAIQITVGTETLVVSLDSMRLYQDVAVRTALQKVVEEPLKRDGVESFRVVKNGMVTDEVSKAESVFFSKPSIEDEVLVDEIRRAAFSIISLAFKEDNKWRLYDGNTQINALIEDREFLDLVDTNQVSFTKGDILMCDVRVKQLRATEGLKTDYTVQRVIEHRLAARQLPLLLHTPPSPPQP